jgi:hypothetical protein
MKPEKELSVEEQQRRRDFRKRFEKALKERPLVSDEEFMAETEVSDEEYALGMVLPGIVDK